MLLALHNDPMKQAFWPTSTKQRGMPCRLPNPGAASMANVGPSDGEVLLEGVEQAAFGNFRKSVNPANGLVADTTRDHWPCSIAVVGFALSVYPVAIERGRVSRDEALDLSLAALPFFRDSDQSSTPDSRGCKGFYYHFLDMQSGIRTWR